MPTWVLGDRDVDFSNGTVEFPWASRQIEAICEKQTLQGRGANPRVFECGDVVRFELEESSLRDQHLGVSGGTLVILLEVKLVSLPGETPGCTDF